MNWITQLRGGQVDDDIVIDNQEQEADVVVTAEEEEEVVVATTATTIMAEEETAEVIESSNDEDGTKKEGFPVVVASMLSPVTGALQSFGSAYASSLNARPIITKSVTACFIFALSDFFAQRLEGASSTATEDEKKTTKSNKKDNNNNKTTAAVAVYNWTRTLTSAAVGLLYFGPAAHAWYGTIFRLLPGTSLVSTLQKAALGQILFGPSFTCVFFATSLLQAGEFSIPNWFRKIKNDLPGAWAAGLGFWPLIDLISFSYIPSQWIPLFVNFCSFIWTIYLSNIANRASTTK